jgi:hypothetical protein
MTATSALPMTAAQLGPQMFGSMTEAPLEQKLLTRP